MRVIVQFTVVCLLIWPLRRKEGGVDSFDTSFTAFYVYFMLLSHQLVSFKCE